MLVAGCMKDTWPRDHVLGSLFAHIHQPFHSVWNSNDRIERGYFLSMCVIKVHFVWVKCENLLSDRLTPARNHNESPPYVVAQADCIQLSACCERLAGACDSKAAPYPAKISFQDWSIFWNMESPRQLDIGGRADFGYPSNSPVMIPKQPRCWKAGGSRGKWLWKIQTVFQPCRHTMVR